MTFLSLSCRCHLPSSPVYSKHIGVAASANVKHITFSAPERFLGKEQTPSAQRAFMNWVSTRPSVFYIGQRWRVTKQTCIDGKTSGRLSFLSGFDDDNCIVYVKWRATAGWDSAQLMLQDWLSTEVMLIQQFVF